MSGKAKYVKPKVKHFRLTSVHKEYITWIADVSAALNATPVQHKNENPWYRRTTDALVREGYLRLSKPDRRGFCRILLTKKGKEVSSGNRP